MSRGSCDRINTTERFVGGDEASVLPLTVFTGFSLLKKLFE